MKTIVITGGSAGIGEAAARTLAAAGHRVVLAARSATKLDDVARSIGPAARTVVADVTRRADVERIRDEALAAFGAIDVWINNAGKGITRSVQELTDDDLDEMVTVNIRSVLYGIQAIVPYFKAQGQGHIINVSSFLARVPLAPQRSAYSAAKAAVNSLTTNLRQELAASHPGIHVTVVMPGIVLTEFAQNARGGGPVSAPVPPVAGAAMQPQTAQQVADVIARLIEQPRPEAYTNPASPGLARRFFADIRAFDDLA